MGNGSPRFELITAAVALIVLLLITLVALQYQRNAIATKNHNMQTFSNALRCSDLAKDIAACEAAMRSFVIDDDGLL